MAHEWIDPAAIEDPPCDAASATCGACTIEPSPAVSEISAAGMTRRRSRPSLPAVVPADMVTVLSCSADDAAR